MAPLADFQAVPLRHALEVQCANLQPDVGTLPVFPRLTGLASHFAGGRVVTSWAGRLSNYEVVAVWQTVNALRFMLTAEQAEGVYEALEGRFRLLVADCEPSVTTRQFAWFEAIRSVPTVRPRVTKATLKVIRGGHD